MIYQRAKRQENRTLERRVFRIETLLWVYGVLNLPEIYNEGVQILTTVLSIIGG